MFEGSNTTQYGFRTTGLGAPSVTGGFLPSMPSTNSTNEQEEMKMVQVNSEQLKSLNKDPVAGFLDTVNQLQFIIDLPLSLDKDIRQIQIENFHRAIFNKKSNGAFIKNEILKLQNGSRDILTVCGFNSCLKNMTYENLLHAMEDLLKQHKYYSQQ